MPLDKFLWHVTFVYQPPDSALWLRVFRSASTGCMHQNPIRGLDLSYKNRNREKGWNWRKKIREVSAKPSSNYLRWVFTQQLSRSCCPEDNLIAHLFVLARNTSPWLLQVPGEAAVRAVRGRTQQAAGKWQPLGFIHWYAALHLISYSLFQFTHMHFFSKKHKSNFIST